MWKLLFLSLQIKNRNTFWNIFCLSYSFFLLLLIINKVWWVNKISAYAVNIFSSFFSIRRAIPLHWFCTLRTRSSNSSLCVSFFFHVVSLFIYFCFRPLSESFSANCAALLVVSWEVQAVELSGMSSRWFLHVMLLMWGYPLHIV